MTGDEAVQLLIGLASGSYQNPVDAAALCDRIKQDWPADFEAVLPSPEALTGRPCGVMPRDWHLRGLAAGLESPPPRSPAREARLSFHARWLACLGTNLPETLPRVSVVVPVYNRDWLLDSLLQNCFSQTYPHVEVVVVDDGSTDSSAQRLAAWGDRITVVRQANSGVSAARNAGIAVASGDLVHFLDSDNLLHPDHILAKVSAFAAIPDADIAYCRAVEVALFGVNPSRRWGPSLAMDEGDLSPTDNLLDFVLAHGYPFLVSAATLPRYRLLDDAPVFDVDLRRGEDWRYWFRLAANGGKAVRLSRQLFDRFRLQEGLSRAVIVDKAPSIVVHLRQLRDLLARPGLWPQAVQFISAARAAALFHRIGDLTGGTFEGDIADLVSDVASLPEAGRRAGSSPLPLLAFLLMLAPRERGADAVWCRVRDVLLTAARASDTITDEDHRRWWARADALAATDRFATTVLDNPPPALAVPGTDGLADGAALLRSLATTASAAERKMRPALAVVIPALDDITAAERTVAACRAQSVKRIEIIVVGRDAARLDLLRRMDDRIVVRQAADRAEACAVGLAAASAMLVRIFDPGEEPRPDALARQIHAARQTNLESVIIETDGSVPEDLRVSLNSFLQLHRHRMVPPLSSMMLSRRVLTSIGGLDAVLGGAFEDRFRFRLLALGCGCVLVDGAANWKPPSDQASAVERTLGSLANLVQSLRDAYLWRFIPRQVRSLPEALDPGLAGTASDARLERAFEITAREISATGETHRERMHCMALALCLAGLAWTDPGKRVESRQGPRVRLRSMVLGAGAALMPAKAADAVMRTLAQEYGGDRSFASAVGRALKAVARDPAQAAFAAALADLRGMVRAERPGWQSVLRRLSLSSKDRKGSGNPPVTVPQPSSITDDAALRGHWLQAARDEATFAHFRRHPVTNRITGIGFAQGGEYAEALAATAPHYRDLLDEFARNDTIGDPIIYAYPGFGNFAAPTIRQVKFVADMEVLFGSLDDLHVIEIGGGWGGQCRLIKARFPRASYTIIDLPEMAQLADRFLRSLGVDDVGFRMPSEPLPRRADLVISNYAISELRRSEQDRYLSDIVADADRGYVLYNAARLAGLVEKHTGERPYQAREFAARIAGARLETKWPFLVARDRNLGNVLVVWNRTRPRRDAGPA